MLQAKINEKKVVTVENIDQKWIINGKVQNIDISKVGKNQLHIIKDQKGYTINIEEISNDKKQVSLKINNKKATVTLKDKTDLLLESLGMSAAYANKTDDIKAPMPGLIIKFLVEPNEAVKKGQGLLVLEAMKMENILKSPHDGVIKEIKVQPKDKVDKNQVLIVFE